LVSQNPTSEICILAKIESVLGKMIYFQLFGGSDLILQKSEKFKFSKIAWEFLLQCDTIMFDIQLFAYSILLKKCPDNIDLIL
jgi:hypothetical protein